MTREEIIETRRVRFEEYYTGAFFKGDKEASSKWLARCEFSGGYLYAEPSDAWKAWSAALDSLEIELPQPDQENDLHQYEAKVIDAIEAQGLKVKP